MEQEEKQLSVLINLIKEQNQASGILRSVIEKNAEANQFGLKDVCKLLERIEQAITGLKVDFDLNPVTDILTHQTQLLKSLSKEQVLLRKIGEGSLEYDKQLGAYRNKSERGVTSVVSGKTSPKGGLVDFETARAPLAGQPKSVIERITNNNVKSSTVEKTNTITQKPASNQAKMPTFKPLPESYVPGDKSGLDQSIQVLTNSLNVVSKKFDKFTEIFILKEFLGKKAREPRLAPERKRPLSDKKITDFKVPEGDKTVSEKLKEVVSIYKAVGGLPIKGLMSLGKGAVTAFKAGKSLLTEPEEFKKKLGVGKEAVVEKLKKAKNTAVDILSAKTDYTVEQERFTKEFTKQQKEKFGTVKSDKELKVEGEKKYEKIVSKEKEISELEKTIKQTEKMGLPPSKGDQSKLELLKSELSVIKSQTSKDTSKEVQGKDTSKEVQGKDTSKEVQGKDTSTILNDITKIEPKVKSRKDISVSEEDDNVQSAQEIIADNSKATTELIKETNNLLKDQLKELKLIGESLVSRVPAELETKKPDSRVSSETSGTNLAVDIPGKRTLSTLGRGAKALATGALSLGGRLAKFATTPAGKIGGAALALGTGAYTAYQGYTSAEEEKQQELQAIDAKEKSGELSPEKAQELRKQTEDKGTENKGGAVGKGAGMAAGAIGGGIAGAKVGAAIGTFFGGPVGTAIGAGVGTIAGGAIGAISGSSVGQNIGGLIGKGVASVKNFFGGKEQLGDKAKAAISGRSEESSLSIKFSETTFAEKDSENYKKFTEFREQRASEIYSEQLKKLNLDPKTTSAQTLKGIQNVAATKAQNEAVKKFQKEIDAAGASSKETGNKDKQAAEVVKKQPAPQPVEPVAGKSDSLTSKAGAIRAEATRLGLEPNKASGVFEGGVLTKIVNKNTGEEYPIEVKEADRKNVEVARKMRDLNQRSGELVGVRQPSSGLIVNRESTENADLNRSASTSAPALPPIISNNVNNNNTTSFVPMKPSVRPEYSGSALDRYNAKVVVY